MQARFATALFALVLVPLGRSDSAPPPGPPIARIEPTTFTEFGHTRVDDYYWLNRREDPEVIAYLEAENAYTEAMTAHTSGLRETLFDEIVGRIKQDDNTVPYLYDGYWYYRRYEEDREYAYYCRKEVSLDAPEEVMLDANERAEGQTYYAARSVQVNSDRNVLVVAEDVVGRRLYTIRFKNLDTDEWYPESIPETHGNLAWAEDGKTLFYGKKDPTTLRPYQIWRHELGTDPAGDALVYQEDDDTFGVYVYKTKSRRYVIIGCDQSVSNEYRYVDACAPAEPFTLFLPRERDHEHSLDHLGGHFYVKTNRGARNFRLMRTPVDATAWENWTEVVPHDDGVLLEGFELFADWLVVQERRDGLTHLRIRQREGGPWHDLDFGEPAYLAWIDTNREPDTDVLRFGYESMTTPESTYDYDMRTHAKTLRKEQEILGGFARDDYVTERITATARDGVEVPISLVYRKGFAKDGSGPLLLYGYGSYGSSMDAYFSFSRLSLLDRGFCYAVAHVRGGEEMGRWWYDDGKLLKKMNTFNDFIDCGRDLVARGYADPARLYAMGGSAGGLLVGAVMNLAPDLFDGVVAQVPFVDVVTTMLDESIPLTTGEYDEWGNPHERESYEYMLAYSPYDNVTARDYPNLLVTTSLHDSQVQYFEPAKWVAKLRALKTDDNLLLLRTDLAAGHGGASGRFKRHRDTAVEYAFLLDLAGVAE
ncbi:S9 family peptidase [bacterium]|nr:S9 family peptidase [bacterium]MBU1072393.1 S9 family peptidase [bacterium]